MAKWKPYDWYTDQSKPWRGRSVWCKLGLHSWCHCGPVYVYKYCNDCFIVRRDY